MTDNLSKKRLGKKDQTQLETDLWKRPKLPTQRIHVDREEETARESRLQ